MESEYSQGDIRQLLDNAFGDDHLKDFCFDHFPRIGISDGRSAILRELADYVCRQGQCSKLLGLVKTENPHAYENFIRSRKESILHEFPEVFNFDLRAIIDQFLVKTINKKGVVGLSIACDDDSFFNNFQQRIKQDICEKNTQIRPPSSLIYHNTVDEVVDDIVKCKNNLRKGDVICPVRVSQNGTASKFWSNVRSSFAEEYDHRLMIVMFGDRNCLFPADVSPLPAPEFSTADAYFWIKGITSKLEKMQDDQKWEEAGDDWIKQMTVYCTCDGERFSDVDKVYDYLQRSLSLLQEDLTQSPGKFLQSLDLSMRGNNV